MKLIFDANNLCTDICKTIFVILDVQFHYERGLVQSRYFEPQTIRPSAFFTFAVGEFSAQMSSKKSVPSMGNQLKLKLKLLT